MSVISVIPKVIMVINPPIIIWIWIPVIIYAGKTVIIPVVIIVIRRSKRYVKNK